MNTIKKILGIIGKLLTGKPIGGVFSGETELIIEIGIMIGCLILILFGFIMGDGSFVYQNLEFLFLHEIPALSNFLILIGFSLFFGFVLSFLNPNVTGFGLAKVLVLFFTFYSIRLIFVFWKDIDLADLLLVSYCIFILGFFYKLFLEFYPEFQNVDGNTNKFVFCFCFFISLFTPFFMWIFLWFLIYSLFFILEKLIFKTKNEMFWIDFMNLKKLEFFYVFFLMNLIIMEVTGESLLIWISLVMENLWIKFDTLCIPKTYAMTDMEQLIQKITNTKVIKDLRNVTKFNFIIPEFKIQFPIKSFPSDLIRQDSKQNQAILKGINTAMNFPYDSKAIENSVKIICPESPFLNSGVVQFGKEAKGYIQDLLVNTLDKQDRKLLFKDDNLILFQEKLKLSSGKCEKIFRALLINEVTDFKVKAHLLPKLDSKAVALVQKSDVYGVTENLGKVDLTNEGRELNPEILKFGTKQVSAENLTRTNILVLNSEVNSIKEILVPKIGDQCLKMKDGRIIIIEHTRCYNNSIEINIDEGIEKKKIITIPVKDKTTFEALLNNEQNVIKDKLECLVQNLEDGKLTMKRSWVVANGIKEFHLVLEVHEELFDNEKEVIMKIDNYINNYKTEKNLKLGQYLRELSMNIIVKLIKRNGI